MPTADSTWFTISLNDDSGFAVYQFSGRESVSDVYEFEVELVHSSAAQDLTQYIGRPAVLNLSDKFGVRRTVHGMVREMEQLHSTGSFTHYSCKIVPRFWFLGLNRNHRIFQDKTVIEIIEEILSEQHGFTGGAYEFRCPSASKLKPREYCVQYNESDRAFISRLCEEEGLYYFFEHDADNHKMVFSDIAGGETLPGRSKMRFFPGSGQASDETIVTRLNLRQATASNMASYRDWNFTKPSLRSLPVSQDGAESQKAEPPRGLDLEHYRYPHIYQLKEEGARYAEIQLQRQLCRETEIGGQSDASHFIPGYVFSLHSHPNAVLNSEWWLLSVSQKGEQPQVLKHEAPERGMSYVSTFTALPSKTRFIPEVRHPKVNVPGQQTAIVTGPKGEEVYPDEYGRVKVQFFWDRLDLYNENSTCWIRVSQGWAGSTYGTMAIPRVGQEVVVSFLEGDPDRPLVTGRVYNVAQMPPYELPAHKTRTVFKSMSTPGEEEKPRGFNELRIEDKSGAEEIYIHAQRDINTHTKNDWKDHVFRDRHRTVDGTTYANTGGETHEKLKGGRRTELEGKDNLTVHADSHFKIDGKWLGKVGSEISLDAGMKVVINAGSEITLKAGGSYLKLDPSGAYLNGARVGLGGGGSPSSGTGASPVLPLAAAGVGASPAPFKPKHEALCDALNLNAAAETGEPVVGADSAARGCAKQEGA